MILDQVTMLPSMQVLRHAQSRVPGAQLRSIGDQLPRMATFLVRRNTSLHHFDVKPAAGGVWVQRKPCPFDTDQTRELGVP
jgi:hypothetical protein